MLLVCLTWFVTLTVLMCTMNLFNEKRLEIQPIGVGYGMYTQESPGNTYESI